jgi:DNA-binding XRE family transcriptional regulator
MAELPYEPLSRDRDPELKRVEQLPGYLEAKQEAAAEFRLLRQLLNARKRCGLSQDEVALRMDTTRSGISRLEGSRKHLPALSTLRCYADVIGCDVEITLVPRSDSDHPASAPRGSRRIGRPSLTT